MTDNNEYCPFISNPCDECYCFRLTSSNINSLLYYCGKNFKQCDIYKRLNSEIKTGITEQGKDFICNICSHDP